MKPTKKTTPRSGEVMLAGEQLSSDDIRALLKVSTRAAHLPPGKGWVTKDALMKQMKVSKHRVTEALRRLRRTGEWEMFRGTEVSAKGFPSNQSWYRKVPANKKTAS